MTSSRSASTGDCPSSSSAEANATREPRASAAPTSVPPERPSNGQQVGALPALRDEHPQQLLLLLQLEEHVARHQRELGPEITERRDGAADLAHRFEPGQLAIDARDEHLFLGAEVVEQAARAGREPRRAFDLRHRRGAITPLAEQPHGLVEQPLPRRT
jgi:hypothetical protein